MKTKIVMLLLATLFLFTYCKKKNKKSDEPVATTVSVPKYPDKYTIYLSFTNFSGYVAGVVSLCYKDTSQNDQSDYVYMNGRDLNGNFDTSWKVTSRPILKLINSALTVDTSNDILPGSYTWKYQIDTSYQQNKSKMIDLLSFSTATYTTKKNKF